MTNHYAEEDCKNCGKDFSPLQSERWPYGLYCLDCREEERKFIESLIKKGEYTPPRVLVKGKWIEEID